MQDASEQRASLGQLVCCRGLVSLLQLLSNQKLEVLGQHRQSPSLFHLTWVAAYGQHSRGHAFVCSDNGATGLKDGQELVFEWLKVDGTDLTVKELIHG
jgi:hypothetical protein